MTIVSRQLFYEKYSCRLTIHNPQVQILGLEKISTTSKDHCMIVFDIYILLELKCAYQINSSTYAPIFSPGSCIID